jgi:uncharacterized membrane protein HdeD (DUF308 family)
MTVETRNAKHETRNRRRWNWPETAALALMLLGIVMVCQPFFHVLFRYGFLVTLAGIIAFTVASHRRR